MYGAGCCVILHFFKGMCLFTTSKKDDSKVSYEYRTQRNLVKKIKRKSIREYFIERCVGGPKLKDFWPTIKSFITNKGSYFENNIILTDDDRILYVYFHMSHKNVLY
jgi:hypothetical protein